MHDIVSVRDRKSKLGKLKDPSTSSATYWQIEKEKDPFSGKIRILKINLWVGQ